MDFCNAYWPLHPSSYNACEVISPEGVHVPMGVLRALKNAAAHFQFKVPQCFHQKQNSLKSWLKDLILFSKTEKELLNHFRTFFRAYIEYNYVLSAKKGKMFASLNTWCGKIIDNEGYWLDPRNCEAILCMKFSRYSGGAVSVCTLL